ISSTLFPASSAVTPAIPVTFPAGRADWRRDRFPPDRQNQPSQSECCQLLVLQPEPLASARRRYPHEAAGLRTYEVDHPATQAWKKRRLSEVGLVPPASVTFVPVNLEEQSLPAELRDAGFDPTTARSPPPSSTASSTTSIPSL